MAQAYFRPVLSAARPDKCEAEHALSASTGPPAEASFSCRVFTFKGEQTGVIPEWFLREKLAGAGDSRERG